MHMMIRFHLHSQIRKWNLKIPHQKNTFLSLFFLYPVKMQSHQNKNSSGQSQHQTLLRRVDLPERLILENIQPKHPLCNHFLSVLL